MVSPWPTRPAAISLSPSAPLSTLTLAPARPPAASLTICGQLVDEHPVQRDPVVRRGRLGQDPHPLGVRLGQDAHLLRFRLGRPDHLGHQLALAQFGPALGQFRLGVDDPDLGLRLA